MPRCGALSLLQKPLHYRGDSAEIASGPKRKIVRSVCVPACVASSHLEQPGLIWKSHRAWCSQNTLTWRMHCLSLLLVDSLSWLSVLSGAWGSLPTKAPSASQSYSSLTGRPRGGPSRCAPSRVIRLSGPAPAHDRASERGPPSDRAVPQRHFVRQCGRVA